MSHKSWLDKTDKTILDLASVVKVVILFLGVRYTSAVPLQLLEKCFLSNKNRLFFAMAL